MSTDAVDFRGAVGTFFDTGWAATTPIAWPGRDYTPPSNGASWVRLSITESDTNQIEIGAPCPQHREAGLIIVQVFTETNKGDGPAITLADQVATIFRRQQVTYTDGRAIFRSPQVRVIGPSAEAEWFQVNVSIPYIRDTLQA
jgi:hypothetical protein